MKVPARGGVNSATKLSLAWMRSDSAGHSTPAGDTVRVAVDLEPVPVYRSRHRQMVYDSNPNWSSFLEKQRRTGQHHRILAWLSLPLQHKSNCRVSVVAIG